VRFITLLFVVLNESLSGKCFSTIYEAFREEIRITRKEKQIMFFH
jgi:hypothetical protein